MDPVRLPYTTSSQLREVVQHLLVNFFVRLLRLLAALKQLQLIMEAPAPRMFRCVDWAHLGLWC